MPRTNRGIFAVNELPDLAERIQVALLNVLEERDIQVRGYQLRLPLDLLLVASANPEDYTNRGRIITPLKDRFGAEIRTHYPLDLELELGAGPAGGDAGRDGARARARGAGPVRPRRCASRRRSTPLRGLGPVRHRRRRDGRRPSALRRGRPARRGASPVARIGDTVSVTSTLRGKVEFESGEEGREIEVLAHLLRTATAETFRARLAGLDLSSFINLVAEGDIIETGELVAGRRGAAPGRHRAGAGQGARPARPRRRAQPGARRRPASSSSWRACT